MDHYDAITEGALEDLDKLTGEGNLRDEKDGGFLLGEGF